MTKPIYDDEPLERDLILAKCRLITRDLSDTYSEDTKEKAHAVIFNLTPQRKWNDATIQRLSENPILMDCIQLKFKEHGKFYNPADYRYTDAVECQIVHVDTFIVWAFDNLSIVPEEFRREDPFTAPQSPFRE